VGIRENPHLRTIFRNSGMKRLYYRGRAALGVTHQYEEQFSRSFLGSVRPGDCVWDVGANVGYYTQRVASIVGTSGKVIAFEPFDETFRRLSATTADLPQVSCQRIALGAQNCEIYVAPVGPASPGNSIANVSNADGAEQISVRTGASLLEDSAPMPNVLKIDVEGFEEDVIWGFGESLRNSACRSLFIEVHFGQSQSRGFPRAPSRLVSRLKDLGFRTHWIGSSALAATRVIP
jgi:FkbM family methyltransferase